jgi:ankyrin repeat protein
MKRIWLVAIALVLISIGSRAAEEPLLGALRAGNTSALQKILGDGRVPDIRDSTGATPLMYATAYGSLNEMRLLLDRGADVNAENAIGATALMWAAHDDAKVKLLLERGAAVNAKTRSAATPLVVAIRFGNAPAVRTLIGAGADVKSGASALVAETHARGNSEIEQSLAVAGVPVTDPRELSAPLATGAALINVGQAEWLLGLGAVPPKNDVRVRTFGAPLLGFAAATYGLPLTRALLRDGGADVNRKGTRGITPLMMAAAATEPDPAVVRLLLEKGADVAARDDSGRTALDWALFQGETSAAQAVRRAGGVSGIGPVSPPTPIATPRAPRAAVEAALNRLLPAGPTFVENGHCISCHNQTLPSAAASIARSHGARVDAELSRYAQDTTLKLWSPLRDELLLGRISNIGTIGGFVGTVAYSLFGFAEEGLQPNLLTDALAVDLAAQQRADGDWNVGDIRPPLFDTSPIHFTALAIRALAEYMPAGRKQEAAARIAKGRQFLRTARPRHTQDEAFKLLGLVWSKAPQSEIAKQRTILLSLQRADGGWGQRPTMQPDPYQTGQCLYALHASGVGPTTAAYQKGAQYLLRTQLQDGSWFMQSRAFAFQPYFETGFPHGTNQFISAAATSWAVIALAYAF